MTFERHKIITQRCVRCGKTFRGYNSFCDQCGDMIDVEYDLTSTMLHDSANTLERFFDLLPLEHSGNMLPINLPRTPCVHAQELAQYLGLDHLYLKDDTVYPTGTTKDRMAAVALSFLRETGITEFSATSTGNSSTSFAYALSWWPEAVLYLFTAEEFLDRVQHAEHPQVVHFVLKDASFVEAGACALKFAEHHDLLAERGFFNPARREGLKLAFLEAAEQVPQTIDWYVQAVSSAMGVYGVYKGARELLALDRIGHLPHLLCVQQETCNPMVRAWRDGSLVIRPEDIIARPTGIASSILRGDPAKAYPYVAPLVAASNGSFVDVGESQIREARRMVEELAGISPCFSASTAMAGLVKLIRQEQFPLHDIVLVNLTGGDRKPTKPLRNIHWLERTDDGWAPAAEADELTWELWRDPHAIRALLNKVMS